MKIIRYNVQYHNQELGALEKKGAESMFFPQQQQPQYEGFNFKQKIVVVLMNVLILAELTISIIFGKRDPENITIVFLAIFIPAVVSTLIVARIWLRKLQKDSPTGDTALIHGQSESPEKTPH